MPRTASLLIYNSSLFPAHWALWIPSAIDPDIGKLLQASGDAVSCFQKDFERNYDIRTITGRHQILQIAEVLDQYVIDVEGEESQSTDQTAYDYLEEIARSVPAPARILVPATSQGPRKRVDIQNCQTWLRAVVAALVQRGMMDQSALQIVDSAPKS